MGELAAGEGAQKDELAATLERQWLQNNQQLGRLAEEKRELEQMNDALVPQMENMLIRTDELTTQLSAAEARANRAEQELAATRQSLQSLQSAQSQKQAEQTLLAVAAQPAVQEPAVNPYG